MKNLKNFITEERIDESLLGTAAAIVAGLIGYGILKSLLKGGTIFLGASLVKKKVNELDEIQNEMTQIISKYPESQEKIKKTYEHILNDKGGKGNDFIFLNAGFGLADHLKGFSEEDKNRFVELFKKAVDLQQGVLKKFYSWDVEDFVKSKKDKV